MTICEKQSGGRILCIRLSGLGDVVHALNALSLLRQERPDAHVTWVVEERFSDLLHGHPQIDELLTVPRALWGRMLPRPWQWRELGGEVASFVRRLRRAEFDVSLDFQSSLKSAWMVRAAGAPLRVGFDRPVSRELSHLVQNALVRVPGRGVHRIERDLALLAPLGIRTRYAAPVLHCSRENAAAVDAWLGGELTGGPLVVIHPGTSRFAAFKRWLPGRYARVADRLVAENAADVVVTWGPGDREVAEQVVGSMTGRGVLAPRLENLQQMVRLLGRTDLFLGGDTGPMHLASAAGTPVVALFGPKDPVQTGPYCSRSIVVTGTAECRPCTRRRCRHVRCMASISVGQVLNAARRVLDGEGACRAEQDPPRAPFTWVFRLGPRRGETATLYSAPEFFTWLCEPDSIVRPNDGQLHPVNSPCDFGAGRFLARRSGGRGGRAAWRSLVGLAERGLPVPTPVCYMEKGPAPDDQLLLVEGDSDALPLPDWLAGSGGPPSAEARTALPAELAAAVRRFHEAGCHHRDMRAPNVVVSRRGGAVECTVVGARRALPVRWLPEPARLLLYGIDLGKLAASLQGCLAEEEIEAIIGNYCDGFLEGPHRRRAFESAFRWRKEAKSWTKRFL